VRDSIRVAAATLRRLKIRSAGENDFSPADPSGSDYSLMRDGSLFRVALRPSRKHRIGVPMFFRSSASSQ
jgi:hypothetical protein